MTSFKPNVSEAALMKPSSEDNGMNSRSPPGQINRKALGNAINATVWHPLDLSLLAGQIELALGGYQFPAHAYVSKMVPKIREKYRQYLNSRSYAAWKEGQDD